VATVPQDRLYGMMQALLASYAQQKPLPVPDEPRGVVEQQDALDAIMQLSAHIDELTQSGTLPRERGWFMAALLMTVREFVKPLPLGIVNGEDLVTADLTWLVDPLRQAREETGLAA
jgi:hypothetical protein